MKPIRIADLKARSRESQGLRIQKPAPGSPLPNRIKVPKRAPLNVEIVALLLEERQGDR